jgi:hypothetical protein
MAGFIFVGAPDDDRACIASAHLLGLPYCVEVAFPERFTCRLDNWEGWVVGFEFGMFLIVFCEIEVRDFEYLIQHMPQHGVDEF